MTADLRSHLQSSLAGYSIGRELGGGGMARVFTAVETSLGRTVVIKTVNVGDASITYELSGKGTAVVLIHGWPQDLTIWDDQVAALSPMYGVLRYDRRSYGGSTGHADPTADPDDLRILVADTLTRRIPNARQVVIAEGGHGAHFAQPERFNAAVLEFLAGVAPNAPDASRNTQ